MDWLAQDWEYPNDEIYAIERQKDIEASWQQWEEDQKRKPATIKVEKPRKYEAKRNTSTVRRAHQEKL